MTEREAVAAALRRLGLDLRLVYTISELRPDEKDRNTKAVDFLADGDHGDSLAIEHTRIGPFNEHEQLQAQVPKILGPLCDELEDLLPAGARFELSFSAAAAPKLRAAHRDPIKAWIMQVAPTLGRPPHHYAAAPADVGVDCQLFRFDERTGIGPRLQFRTGFQGSDDLERLRLARVRRAMEDKLPKLDDARSAHGVGTTLLVLESSDHQATNAWAVHTAVQAATDGLPLPDHVVLVESSAAYDVPLTWTLRRSGSWISDDDLAWVADNP